MGILSGLGLGGLMGAQNSASSFSSQAQAQYNQAIANQSLSQYQQSMANNIAGLGRPLYRPRWMIDGREMSIEQFADELFGADTPEKTMFLLKYSK